MVDTPLDGTVFEDEPEGEFEARDYFEDLKNRVHGLEIPRLESAQRVIANEIEKAKRLGQKNLAHKTAYLWTVIAREFALHALGYRDYVLRDDVTKFIDKVTPRNSVKVVELARFPRVIPDVNAAKIQQAVERDIFDQIVIVYTDFTDESVQTAEEIARVQRNTDPVAFGVFREDKLKLVHDRMYLITDWEDEFCDLTFSRLIDKMSEIGIKNSKGHLTGDSAHINRICEESLAELNEITSSDDGLRSFKTEAPQGLVATVMSWFGKGV